MRRVWSFALLLGCCAMPAQGQTGGGRECDPAGIAPPGGTAVAEQFLLICHAVLQGLVSAPPQIGILAASGNPVLASHSAGGLRLGRFPVPLDATLRLEAAVVRLPNLLAEDPAALGERLLRFAPAISADLAVGVFEGVQLSPQVRGAGAVDLLGSLGALPVGLSGALGTADGAGAVALGTRVGLVREGFATPGISVTLMHHWLSRVALGNVCPDGLSGLSPICPGPGSLGQLTFDLRSWSGRAVVGRRSRGFGVTGGGGYDRFTGSGGYVVRIPGAAPGGAAVVYARPGRELRDGRWSAFGNASYTHLLLTVAAELGWMQGGAPVAGFEQFPSDFNPRRGTFFGGVGGRLAF